MANWQQQQESNYVMNEPIGQNQPYPQQMKPPITEVYTYNAPSANQPRPATMRPPVTDVYTYGRQLPQSTVNNLARVNAFRGARPNIMNIPSAMDRQKVPAPPPAFPRQPGQMPGMRRFAGRLGGSWNALRDKVNQQRKGRMYDPQQGPTGGLPNAPVRPAVLANQPERQSGAWGGQVRGLLNRLR